MRTVIYARFSSHLQNSRSIDDQIAVCRDRANREGWEVVDVFTDYAISGAAGTGENARPGLNACLAAIDSGGVDQLLAESTDRIARHQGDAFAIRERVNFAGARIFTLSDGEVDDITGTIKGLFDARFRKELGAKIKRGQRGTVAAGRVPAGIAYGYRKANRLEGDELVRGLRTIDPEESAVVLRIFTEYAAGQSPRAIAERLNLEGIPGPRGGTWRTSTIAGERVRQNGILQNRLYNGIIVHNRTRKVTDPTTRRTLIKPNPESEWFSEPAPQLRVVGDELWHLVQERRQRHNGHRPERCRRPKHLLSGLVFCGICGGGWTIVGNGYWACGRYRDGRGCTNNRSVSQPAMEGRVLSGLSDQMLHPDVVEAYVEEYHRHFEQRMRELRSSKGRLTRVKHEADVRINRLVEAIAAGADVEEVRVALGKAREARDAAIAELDDLESLDAIPLHPAIAKNYRSQIARLTESLAEGHESRLEVVPQLQALLERIVVYPAQGKRGVEFVIEGRLASILALATGEAPSDRPITITGERVKGIEPSS